MDWLTWLELTVLLCAVGAGTYASYRFAARTRQAFRACQPDLRITNFSAMTSGDILTLSPELDNVGGGVAHNCLLQLGGWDGSFTVKQMFPRGPHPRNQTIAIVLGPDAPIRTKLLSNGYLRLCYQDRWGLMYECWYPVTQQRSHLSPLYNIQIDLKHPDHTKPRPTVWEMWKLLRTSAARD